MTTILTSVVIPTYKRRESLKRAIDSMMAQTGIDRTRTEILVVDNDPERSANWVAEAYQGSPVELCYFHEPTPGVANVRNTAMDNIRGRFVAFLDDDQSAAPNWLAKMLDAHAEYGAIVTFCPTNTSLPGKDLPHADYLETFFARSGPKTSGLYDDFYGAGNSLMDMDQVPPERPLFDARMNESGGEDDVLYSSFLAKGHKFGWTIETHALEHVPLSRANLNYALRRTFAYGQAPTTIAARQKPVNVPALIYWSIIGTGQALVYGTIAGVFWLIRHPKRAFWLDRAIQGIGKPLWFEPFSLKFYGTHTR